MGIEDQKLSDSRYRAILRTLIFIFDRERVLLIRGAPNKHIWANRYNGIGGHVEAGEDIISAAKRELSEESGLFDIDLTLAGLIHVIGNGNPGVLIFVFWGLYNGKQLTVSSEGRGEWILTSQVNEFPVVDDIPFIVPEVINSQRTGKIFSARTNYDEAKEMVIKFF